MQPKPTSRRATPKKQPPPTEGMVLHIELRHSHPLIHRTLLVPANITLRKLSLALEIAMGWESSHLHEFIIDGIHYLATEPDYPDPATKSERYVRLNTALGTKRTFDYIYDFGDNWEHRIKLLKRIPLERPMKHPQCLDGAYACPPEDVGGIFAYAYFLEAITNPEHLEHEDKLEWYGGPFDPAEFDLDEVNEWLRDVDL